MSHKKGSKKSAVLSAEESETTENEFSELEGKNEVKKRGINQQEALRKIKEKVNQKPEVDPNQKQSLDRNVPIPVKASNFKVRTIWTLVMLFLFIGIIAAGHFYCTILILIMNFGMVKEILSLKRNRERESEIRFSVGLNWWFFGVIVFYFYGKLFTSVLARVTLTNRVIYLLVNYHDFITFALWVTGFLMFTLSLKKGYLRYQFRQFGWTHIAVTLIVGQGSAIVNNVYEGIIWFILPALLVISNDIFAYVFGILYGKTRLIELSPKKTVEGFIGGMFSTFIVAFLFSWAFSQFHFLTCPQRELVLKPFQFETCETPLTFQFFDYYLPDILGLGKFSIRINEFQIHSLVFALFASLVSPFGGFFASGFKRAIKVKDFADVIPGHGGITDRMDCQVLTGTFVYMYVQHIVNGRINYVNGVSRFIMNEMDITQQLYIFKALQESLVNKGLLNSTITV